MSRGFVHRLCYAFSASGVPDAVRWVIRSSFTLETKQALPVSDRYSTSN